MEDLAGHNEAEPGLDGDKKGRTTMFEELTNGNYFIYQISDGGCGLVKAINEAHAAVVVANAYHDNNSGNYDPSDIEIYPIDDGGYKANMPNVIELGWKIEID